MRSGLLAQKVGGSWGLQEPFCQAKNWWERGAFSPGKIQKGCGGASPVCLHFPSTRVCPYQPIYSLSPCLPDSEPDALCVCDTLCLPLLGPEEGSCRGGQLGEAKEFSDRWIFERQAQAWVECACLPQSQRERRLGPTLPTTGHSAFLQTILLLSPAPSERGLDQSGAREGGEPELPQGSP